MLRYKNYSSETEFETEMKYISRDINLFRPGNGFYLATSPSPFPPFQITLHSESNGYEREVVFHLRVFHMHVKFDILIYVIFEKISK